MKMNKEVNWLLKEKYNGILTQAAKKDIMRLEKGEPLDYIIGFTEFFGCKIDLSKKPLIPRPETEYWLEKAIERISSFFDGRQNKGIAILDLFAGSGCIGIAVLTHMPNATVVFGEKEGRYISQIKVNAILNHIPKKRYKAIKTDVFSHIKGTFDVVLANPPYIPTSRKGKVQTSVLQYEPTKALFGGKEGLFYIKKCLKEAKKHLKEDGVLYIEFDSIQKNDIAKLLKKYQYRAFEFFKDQYGKYRYVVIQ